jgi:glycosyltransferase involved in cell wall biosynthesis
MTPSKLAIVPAYNEEASVAWVVTAIHEHAPDFDVLVVDDGSTDRTSAEAERAGASVVQHPFNLGIGGAVQSGFKFAQRNGYDIAAQVDGDGQHDPAYLPSLVEALRSDDRIDMVSGSRFLEQAGYRVPLRRRMGIKIFSLIVSLLVREKITDPTSGFRVTGRRGIELFARDYPHDYPEVEAILLMHAHRLRSSELAVRMNSRIGGRSSITPSVSVYYMVKVSLALLVGLFRRRPAVEAGAPALVTAQKGI